MTPGKLIRLLYTWALLVTFKVDASIKKLRVVDEYDKLYEIENGYEKPDSKSALFGKYEISRNMVDDELDNIRCGFTFIALSYMCISEYLLRWDGEDRIDAVIDHIEPIGQHAYKMIVILYNVGAGRFMFDMWLFYLYASKIQMFGAYVNSGGKSSFRKNLMDIYDIHLNIMEKLKKNVRRCRNNRLYVDSRTTSLYESYKFLSRSDDTTVAFSMIREHYTEVNKLIAHNDNLTVGTENAEYFKIDRLYLNDLILKDDIIDELQNVFDRNITWGNTNDVLKKTWDNLKNPVIVFDGLSGFQKYHSQFKNVIKTIILRIIWSHLLILERLVNINMAAGDVASQIAKKSTLSKINNQLLNKLVPNRSTVSKKNKKLMRIIIPLLSFLELQADGDLIELVKCLKKEPWQCLEDGLGIALISKMLELLASRFEGLNAFDGVLNEEQELKDNYSDWTELAEKRNLSVPFLPDKKFTAYNINYTRAVIFSEYVHHILENVDFKLMKSIFESSNFTRFDGLMSSQIRYEHEMSVSTRSSYLSSEDNTESQQLASIDDDDEIEIQESILSLDKPVVELETGETSNKNREHSLDDSDTTPLEQINVSGENILYEPSKKEPEPPEDGHNENVENNIQDASSSSEEKQETGERENNKIENNLGQENNKLKEDEAGDSDTETLLNKNVKTENDLNDTLPIEPDKVEISNEVEEIGFENSKNTHLEESPSVTVDKSINNEIEVPSLEPSMKLNKDAVLEPDSSEIHEHVPMQVGSNIYNSSDTSGISLVEIRAPPLEPSPRMDEFLVLEPDASAIHKHASIQVESDKYNFSDTSGISSVEIKASLPEPSTKIDKVIVLEPYSSPTNRKPLENEHNTNQDNLTGW